MRYVAPLLIALAVPCSSLIAQTTAGSATSTPTTGDVSAGTYGSGTSDADSVGVSGGGSATAAEGGTAQTDSSARFNKNNAMQRSTASAKDEDERARSRTMTHARKDGAVRSKSMSIYKERGEKPVITRDSSTSSPN